MRHSARRTASAADLPTVGTPLSDPTTPRLPEPATSGDAPAPPSRRLPRLRWPLAAALTVLAALAATGVTVATAHKTVLLDVDGQVTEVGTFAGSVEGLLAERGIELGLRDVVAPAQATPVRDGDEVVVRRARQVTISDAAGQAEVWTTGLDADEVLRTLATRSDEVSLVASRSGDRADLGIPLSHRGSVRVEVDGRVLVAEDGASDLPALLQGWGITLGELDRVSVRHGNAVESSAGASLAPGAIPSSAPSKAWSARGAADALVVGRAAPAEPPADGLTVVIQRVAVTELSVDTPLAFETVVEKDAARFADLPARVREPGAEGILNTVYRVVTVDGVEESRETVSEAIVTPPAPRVVVEGTKERPVEPVAAPAAEQAAGSPAAASQAPADVWAALARCESGGNPGSVSANGKYHGLYQFSVATWASVGGSGLPSQASAEEQTQRAQALQARSGWGQWPACSRKLGLR